MLHHDCLQTEEWVTNPHLNESHILTMAANFHDMIDGKTYDNAIDISTCMRILSHILNAQVCKQVRLCKTIINMQDTKFATAVTHINVGAIDVPSRTP